MNDLRLASSKINHEAYLRYKLSQSRSPDYFVQKHVDTTTNEVIMCVQSQRHPDAPPRKFSMEVNSRCNCNERIAEQDMCVHEIVVKGGFLPQLFEERHFQRKHVSGSLNGWIAPPKEKVDEIIGLCPEVIEVTSNIPIIQASNELNDALVFNPFSKKESGVAIPLDYLPERRATTNPFTKKEV